MPRRGAEQQDRNAAIIMTYFHPYTLNPELDTDVHVPYIGNLCRGVSTWHETMLRCFDGNVLSEESRRHMNNYPFVTRARPDAEADEDENSEDMQSDEELFLNKTDLAQALISKMGVGPENRKETLSTAPNDDVDVRAVDKFTATETFRKAQTLWRVPN